MMITHQITFEPVDAPLPMVLIKAQISRMRTINPKTPVTSKPITEPLLLKTR